MALVEGKALSSGSKSKLMKEIRQQRKKGDFSAALTLALQLKDQHSDNWEGHFYHSRVLLDQGKYIEAKAILDHSLQLFPAQLELLLDLAACHRKLKNITETLKIYDWIISHHPDHWESYVRKADILTRIKKVEEAKEVLEKGRLACPRQMNILKTLSSTYRLLGLRQESLEVSLLFVIYHPTSPIGYLRSSQDLIQLGRISEAKSILFQGASIVPAKTESFLTAYLIILDRLQDAGDYQAMLAESTSLADNFESYWHGHVTRIRALVLNDQLDDALARLEDCKSLFPTNKHVAQVEGFVFEKLNEQSQSESAYSRYLELSLADSAKGGVKSAPSNEEIVASIQRLFDKNKQSFYTHLAGVSNFIPPQQPHFNERIAKVVFDIFDHYELEYFVFAGSVVGYVRNGCPPVWVDDIDVCIFQGSNKEIFTEIIPVLRRLGLRAPMQGAKGGYHILGFQQITKLAYDDAVEVKVRKFQMDVFLTTEDCLRYARNIKSWGLYSEKNVPVSWIKPASSIALFGRNVPAFRFYEKDILLEYGDVKRNVVISSHVEGGRTFLRLPSVEWQDFQRLFDVEYFDTPKTLPASLPDEMIGNYQPNLDIVVGDQSAKSFAEICSLIATNGAGEIHLFSSQNLWWILDIKQLFPGIRISASVNRGEDLLLVLATRDHIFKLNFANDELQSEYDSFVVMQKS